MFCSPSECCIETLRRQQEKWSACQRELQHAVRPPSKGLTAAPVQPPLALTVRVKAVACAAQSRMAALHNATPASRAITLRSTATDRRNDRETLRSGAHGDSMGASGPTIQSYRMSGVLRASVQDGCADRLAVRDFLVPGNTLRHESHTLGAAEHPVGRIGSTLPLGSHCITLARWTFDARRW